jgi:hypothetical protein
MPSPSARGGVGGLLASLLMLGSLLAARRISRAAFTGRRHREPRVDQKAVAVGHELHEVSPVPVIVAGVLLAVAVGLAVAVVTLFGAAKIDRPLSLNPPPVRPTPAVPPLPPEPRLEEVPGEQLRQVRAAEDQVLNSAGWVDRQAGVARIPIDRAIDLTVQQGLPARSIDEARAFHDDASSAPSDASSGRTPERRMP